MNVNAFIKFFSLFIILFLPIVSAASISTDKSEYKFEETVTIYGTEFPPNLDEGILLDIYNPNDVTIFQDDVSTDQDGNFTTTYFIPAQDHYRIEGTYTVYASTQSGSAYTTFDATGIDTTPPTFSGNQTNETQPGKPCEFTLTWDDDRALHPFGQYIFSTNNSGTWLNATPINFTSTSQTVTNITTLNDTESIVQWKYYASDNSSNWAESDTYEVNVITPVPCELQEVTIAPDCGSDCGSGEAIIVNATYSGDCPDRSYIQVNAEDTDCSICDQGKDTCEDDLCNMTGITVVCSESPCSAEWEIPDVPAECQDETLDATYSSLNSDYPCDEDSEKKDEVTPTGSFTFALTTTVPATTTSPGGDGGTTTVTATTTFVTTTPITTVPAWTTSPEYLPTTMPTSKEGGTSTYWIIGIVIVAAAVGVFVWFKFFRTPKKGEFEKLKEKWSRRYRR